ncbi:MAG: rhomboid-like protein [Candidatus Nanopelagicales bacterium]
MPATQLRSPSQLLRTHPVTFAYGTALAATATVAWISPATNDRLYDYFSTNLDNLDDHPLRALFGSGLLVDGQLLPNLMMALVPIALSERRIGSAATAGVFVAGHVGASLLTARTIANGLANGYYPISVRSDRDVGVSYGSLTIRFALIGEVRPGWPRALAAGSAAAWLAATQPWRLPRDFTSTGHVIAAGLGVAVAGVIAARRRGSRSLR